VNNEAIEFIVFSVLQTKDSLNDVHIDLKEREFSIEKTDLYGKLMGERQQGKLRRSKVKQFKEELADIDVISWERNEEDTLPINLKDASLIYIIEDTEYYTTGDTNEGMPQLHNKIENLVGTTFGSYEFY